MSSLPPSWVSLNSTIGDLGLPATVSREIKRLCMNTATTFKLSQSGVVKPCVTLAVMGEKGAGVTTLVLSIVSCLLGKPCPPYESSTPESDAERGGELAVRLIPVHSLLWENVDDVDAPFLFYLWDVPLPANTNEQLIQGEVGALLHGTQLPNRGLGQIRDDDMYTPAPIPDMFIFCMPAARVLQLHADDNAVKVLRALVPYVESFKGDGSPSKPHRMAMAVTQADAESAGLGLHDGDATSLGRLPSNPGLITLTEAALQLSKIPYDRVFTVLGLDTLRVSSSPNWFDLRESLVLALTKACATSVVTTADLTRDPLQVHDAAVENVRSLLHMTEEQLSTLLEQRHAPAAARVVREQRLDGRCVYRSAAADIKTLFLRYEVKFGEVDQVLRLAEPYWTLRDALTTAQPPRLSATLLDSRGCCRA